MNKKNRKTKGFSHRLVALLLCCACLFSVTPISAIALGEEAAPAASVAEAQPEEAAELQVAEPEAEAEPEEPAQQEEPAEPEAAEAAEAEEAEAAEAAPAAETADTTPAESEAAEAEQQPAAEPETAAEVNVESQAVDADAAEETSAENEPVAEETEADNLYDRLMACTTYEEMQEILNGLTEEEQALLDNFTEEQNDALEAKVNELGGYAVDPLENRKYSIEQGGTQSVSIDYMSSSKFSYSCDQAVNIKASMNTNWLGRASGYTISVGSDVTPGTYTLTVKYNTWDGNEITDTVTITVTRSGNYLTVINKMTNADVVYFKIENNVITERLIPVTSDSPMEITLPSTSDAIVYFVKPKDGYLLTQFYREEGGTVDLYSVDTAAKDCNFQYFKNNTTTGDAILEAAKAAGYLGYFGFTGPSGSGYTGTFIEVAEAPQMSISAVATPNTDLKPGDNVTFTITVTPGDLSTGANYTVKDTTITSLTINGTPYTATKNADGTYSVDYVITEEDWVAKKATLDVTASLTYNYVVPVKDRNNLTGNIRTEATITSSATTDCAFATKKGVLYQLSYDAPAGVNPPLDASLADYIPAAPVDDAEYFEGRDVFVKDYDRTDVDDPVNKGTWTFTGWANGEQSNLQAQDKVTMVGGGLLFTGVWKFTEYPTYDLTIKKTVSGNMYDPQKKFKFTVVADKPMTWGDQSDTTFTFDLAKDGNQTITVPVGATVTVTENPEGYTHTVAAETSITEYEAINEENRKGISFTMPKDDTTVVFNNDKTVTIDTGVVLDTLPYVLILAVVAGGAVLMVKKRGKRDSD